MRYAISFVEDNEWFRSSEVFGEQSFVHWWYYPDRFAMNQHVLFEYIFTITSSYDSLLPVSEVEIDGETPEPKCMRLRAVEGITFTFVHAAVWEVQGRWLTDLKTYNEFMNEEDYEVEDAEKLLSKSQKSHFIHLDRFKGSYCSPFQGSPSVADSGQQRERKRAQIAEASHRRNC